MIFLVLTIVVLGYVGAASWAAAGGQVRLWLTAVAAFTVVILASMLLGMAYAVPDLARLLLYVVTLVGPILLVPTLLLARTPSQRTDITANLRTALAGALLGLAVGFVVVVFVLGVW